MRKNKLHIFADTLLQLLGLERWHTQEDKNILNEADKARLETFGFNKTFIDAFNESLSNDFRSEEGEEPEPAQAGTQLAVVNGLLAQKTQQLASCMEELSALRKTSEASKAEIAGKDAEITALREKVSILSASAEQVAASHAPAGSAAAFDLSNDRQLGGMEGVMYAMEGRPYNQRARAALLAREGVSVMAATENAIDYSRLKEDLGAFHRVSWRNRLQSFLTLLPSIESIFPLESGYQDLATLANIWLGEFSQADNSIGSDFDKVTKGSYEFDSETLRMYSVMFAHKFRDLKQLEKTWIGSLNREGSQSIKWSFIEFILAETAKKLHNERELRRVNGVRRDPDPNKPGRAMEASDGVYEFLRKKVDGYIDINNGKKVYQLKPFELGAITEANIGEKVFKGTGLIPAVLRDSGRLCLYMPSYMITWYHKYNEIHYGVNQDYKANIMYVKEYPAVKLVPVPNADRHSRIFWTLDGNIKTYEHVAGEMTSFNIEQQDWTLKVWSQWKESVWAQAVGFKYTNRDEMDYSRQMIFLNETDLRADVFIDADKDSNPDVTLHSSVQTVANTQLLAITDIEGAETGQTVTIKCGSVDKGVTIAKADKFSLLTAGWTPAVGDTITLMKRADGKFIELGRTNGTTGAIQIANDATVIAVEDGTEFVTGANTKATAITDLTGAVDGQIYTLHGAGSANASTIAAGGKFVLTAAMTLSEGASIRLVATGGKFYEVSRS